MRAIFEWLGEDTTNWDTTNWDTIAVPYKPSYVYHRAPEDGIIYTTTYILGTAEVRDILTRNEKKYLKEDSCFILVTRDEYGLEDKIMEITYAKSLSNIYYAQPVSEWVYDRLRLQHESGYIYHLENLPF